MGSGMTGKIEFMWKRSIRLMAAILRALCNSQNCSTGPTTEKAF